jgi:hypothetical protein
MVLLLCLFLALPQAAFGDPEEHVAYFRNDFPSPDDESLANLEKILASRDFGGRREGWGIRLKNPHEPMVMPDIDFSSWMERMEKIRQVFAFILRFLVVLVIVAFFGFVLYWFLFRWEGLNRFQHRGKSYTNPLLSPESPESLFTRAEYFFSSGLIREAWAACLSGCLGACVRHRSISFPADATEYGCLDLVRRALPAESEGFGELVQSWILFAYGGRLPAQGAFEQAIAYGRSLLQNSKENMAETR